jgi:hypothetical protein
MLEIERMPSYLSPSSLNAIEKMPNKFFLERLCIDRDMREPQSINAAIGSAFDYLIKEELIQKKFPQKTYMLKEIKKGVENNQVEAWEMGRRAFLFYKSHGLNKDEYVDVEMHWSKTIEGVPLLGKGDSVVEHNEIVIPHDWKITGYNSKSTSPAPYYYKRYTEHGRGGNLPHKKYTYGVSMENINLSWATQTATYGWLMGKPLGEPFMARIDQVAFKGEWPNVCTNYLAQLTHEFQTKLMERYKVAWNSLRTGSFLNRLASTHDKNLIRIASFSEKWF